MGKFLLAASLSAFSLSAFAEVTETQPKTKWYEDYWNASDVAFGVYFMTDNVDRGISGSNNKASFATYAKANYGPFYAGGFYMPRDFGPMVDARAEADYFVGFNKDFGPVKFDIASFYVDLSPSDDYNYIESYAALTYNFPTQTSLTFKYGWTDNMDDVGANLRAYELIAMHALTDKWYLSGNVGHRDLENWYGPNYEWLHLGVTYQFTPFVGVDLKYKTTNLTDAEGCYPEQSCKSKVYAVLRLDQSLRNILAK